MAVVSLKSISGITSITNAAGANDVLTFHSNNTTERLRIDSNGNVYVGGVGASATAGLLWLNDTSAHASKIWQDNGNSALVFGTGSGQVEKLRITSTGLVTNKGTWTNTYAANDTTQCGYQVQNLSDATNTYAALRLTAGTSSPATAQIASVRTGAGANDLTFQVEASNTAKEALRIKSDGKIGIGINAPVAPLHIYAATNDNLLFGGNINASDGGAIRSMNSDASAWKAFELLSAEMRIGGTNSLRLSTGGTGGSVEALRIDNTGRLLLGAGAVSLPKGSGAGSFDLDNGNITMCIGGNVNSTGRTNSTNKINRITSPHYTNAEEPVALISSYNTSSANSITYGGGSSSTNAATEHAFYVGGNTNSTTGALKFKIDTNGDATFYEDLNVANYIRTNAQSAGGAHMYFKNNSQGANYSSHFQTYASSDEAGTTQTWIHYYHDGYAELMHKNTSSSPGSRIRTLNDGVQFRNGNTVIAQLTSNGLAFGTETGADHHLNDYEEGSWTPYMGTNNQLQLSANYSYQSGRFVKIGELVYVMWEMVVTNTPSGTAGYPVISGLPVAPLSSQTTGGYPLPLWRDFTAAPSNLSGFNFELAFKLGQNASYGHASHAAIWIAAYNSTGNGVAQQPAGTTWWTSGRCTGTMVYRGQA